MGKNAIHDLQTTIRGAVLKARTAGIPEHSIKIVLEDAIVTTRKPGYKEGDD